MCFRITRRRALILSSLARSKRILFKTAVIVGNLAEEKENISGLHTSRIRTLVNASSLQFYGFDNRPLVEDPQLIYFFRVSSLEALDWFRHPTRDLSDNGCRCEFVSRGARAYSSLVYDSISVFISRHYHRPWQFLGLPCCVQRPVQTPQVALYFLRSKSCRFWSDRRHGDGTHFGLAPLSRGIFPEDPLHLVDSHVVLHLLYRVRVEPGCFDCRSLYGDNLSSSIQSKVWHQASGSNRCSYLAPVVQFAVCLPGGRICAVRVCICQHCHRGDLPHIPCHLLWVFA